VLLAFAYVGVTAVLVAMNARGNWISAPSTIAVAATGFQLLRGSGQPGPGAFVVESPDATGMAILQAKVVPFAAHRYSRVDWKIVPPGAARPALSFVWRTREQPNRTFAMPLAWLENGVAPLELTAEDGWNGTISGVALMVRGKLQQPLVVQSVTIPGISAVYAAREIGGQWTAWHPFTGGSIAFPFDAERDEHLSLLAATALAQGLAIGAYLLLARRRKWPLDARVLWAVFLGGWLVLDVRWQVNLWRQLAATAQQFAGKSSDDKSLAAIDGPVFALIREMRAALPAPPVRILVLSDSHPLRSRVAYFLYPHSVNGFYQSRAFGKGTVDPADFHPGDYLLLLFYTGATYDRASRALVWPDGRRQPVDEVAFKAEGIALVRIR
jgi:hypothetical protein